MNKYQFENLIVWQKAHELVMKIYKLTNSFPKTEVFGLTNQIRRSCTSIPANLVEGRGRKSKKEYLQFIYIARGSLEETKYHLLLARDLEYISKEDYNDIYILINEVGKLLYALRKSLES